MPSIKHCCVFVQQEMIEQLHFYSFYMTYLLISGHDWRCVCVWFKTGTTIDFGKTRTWSATSSARARLFELVIILQCTAGGAHRSALSAGCVFPAEGDTLGFDDGGLRTQSGSRFGKRHRARTPFSRSATGAATHKGSTLH